MAAGLDLALSSRFIRATRAGVPARRSIASAGSRAGCRPACESRSTAVSAPRRAHDPRRGRDAARRRLVDLCQRRPRRRVRRPRASRLVTFLERAIALADAAAGLRTRIRLSVRSSSATARSSGGATEEYGGRHGEIVALDAAGERARGADLYVTMEPCAHHGRTPPCVDRIVADRRRAGRRCVQGPESVGQAAAWSAWPRAERRRSFATRGRRGVRTRPGALGRAERPFVVYKAAATIDGRITMPGSRWITGEPSRRLVHELRAQMDAVAVGTGTVRADAPRLDARDVPTPRGSRGGSRSARRRSRPGRRWSSGPATLPRSSIARGRRRSVASPRGRTDPRGRVPRPRSRRQAPRLRGTGSRRCGAGARRCATLSAVPLTAGRTTGRRGRSP